MIEAMTIVGACVLFVAGFAFWLWMEIESAKKFADCRRGAQENGYVKPPPPKPSAK